VPSSVASAAAFSSSAPAAIVARSIVELAGKGFIS
jgi:hypothetical protein